MICSVSLHIKQRSCMALASFKGTGENSCMAPITTTSAKDGRQARSQQDSRSLGNLFFTCYSASSNNERVSLRTFLVLAALCMPSCSKLKCLYEERASIGRTGFYGRDKASHNHRIFCSTLIFYKCSAMITRQRFLRIHKPNHSEQREAIQESLFYRWFGKSL